MINYYAKKLLRPGPAADGIAWVRGFESLYPQWMEVLECPPCGAMAIFQSRYCAGRIGYAAFAFSH